MRNSNSQVWKALLKGSFGNSDMFFASHPLDEERAVRMFHAAIRAGATLERIQKEARKFLESEGCAKTHIERELKRIRNFTGNPYHKLNSKKAWLVTWVGSDIENEVVAIFNYRKSPKTVLEFLEQFYIATGYSDTEKLIYAKNKKHNPYPAEYERVNGILWQGRIHCGHNPHLYACYVTNLGIVKDENDREKLVWEEIPKPEFPK